MMKKREFRFVPDGQNGTPSVNAKATEKSNCQLMSALCSSCCKNLASACGLHSGSEAMNLGTLSLLRLKRHLRHRSTPPCDL